MGYYPSQQIKDELIRLGKLEWVGKVGGSYRYKEKDVKAIERRWKAKAHEPTPPWTFCDILKQVRTPWGKPQTVHKLVDGIFSISTASHGGLWLSDEWLKKLPKEYKPYTGNRRWAEEDEDWAIVLHYFGLLSLVSEPLALKITEEDIRKGRESRKPYSSYSSDEMWSGGAIAEAYQRQTGEVFKKWICTTERGGKLQPWPGGFKIAKLSPIACDFQKAADKGLKVEPTTVFINPYDFTLPAIYKVFVIDGKVYDTRVSGYFHNLIQSGDKEAIEREFYIAGGRVLKVEYKGNIVWEKAA